MRIGTRSTAMAIAQTEEVAAQLQAAHSGLAAEIVRFSPRGDRDQISKLDRHGGKGGAFVEEIRHAMREGDLQAAMHSLKDMPGNEETPGLTIAAMMKREQVEDVLALRPDHSIKDFLNSAAEGMKIGTNSVRRAAYLRRLFPKAEIIHYRGAADTRIKKLDERTLQKTPDGSEVGPADAIVLARCGMMRVGLEDRIAHVFTLDEMLPAVGQGVVAVECAQGDWETRSRLAAIDHDETRACAEAERELLWVLDGHCNSPIAGHGELNGDQIKLRGAVISEDGAEIIETSAVGEAKYPRELGRQVGLELLRMGAERLILASRIEA